MYERLCEECFEAASKAHPTLESKCHDEVSSGADRDHLFTRSQSILIQRIVCLFVEIENKGKSQFICMLFSYEDIWSLDDLLHFSHMNHLDVHSAIYPEIDTFHQVVRVLRS